MGMHRVTAAKDAEIIVLNTCTVTSAADQDARAAIRRVHRQQPGARVLVTGCYAQRAPGELSELEGVRWVVGNSLKHRIGNIVAGSDEPGMHAFLPASAVQSESGLIQPFHAKIYSSDIFAHTELQAAPVFDGIARTRPNLKIQDGCNNRCSFCVIPFVRGQSRSMPADQVIEQVRQLGVRYREVVLSGINLGRWGREPGSGMRLADLLRRLLAETTVDRL